MTGYINNFKENITMSLRVKDKQLFKKYIKICKKNLKANKDSFSK